MYHETSYPTFAVPEMGASKASFSNRCCICLICSLRRPISAACSVIRLSSSVIRSGVTPCVTKRSSAITGCCLAIVVDSSAIISPLPVMSHVADIFAFAHTFSRTSKDGFPCRVPTTFSMTVGVTPTAIEKALLLPLYNWFIMAMNRSFILIII